MSSTVLHIPIKPANHIVFEKVGKGLVLKAAKLPKGGDGPSRMEADRWRYSLVSRVYGDSDKDFR